MDETYSYNILSYEVPYKWSTNPKKTSMCHQHAQFVEHKIIYHDEFSTLNRDVFRKFES